MERCVFVVASVEVHRTRRAHSSRPDGDASNTKTRARSPSPLRSSGKDSSWRDKLGAGEKRVSRDTVEVEKPSNKIRFIHYHSFFQFQFQLIFRT